MSYYNYNIFLYALFQLYALDLPLEQSYNTFNLILLSTNYTKTRTQVVLSLVASAFASPIDLTPEVAKATEEHLAAHAAATAGEHAALAPVQGAAIAVQGPAVVSAYLDDEPDVAAAKAEFEKLFKAAEAGTPIVPALPALPVAAPVAPVAPAVLPYGGYYGNYLGGYHGLGYNGLAYNGLAGYPYYNGAYAGYAGYPFGHLPYQLAAPAAKEE